MITNNPHTTLPLEHDDLRARVSALEAEVARLKAAAYAFHCEIAPMQQPGIDWLDAQISGGALEEFEAAFGLGSKEPAQGEEVRR